MSRASRHRYVALRRSFLEGLEERAFLATLQQSLLSDSVQSKDLQLATLTPTNYYYAEGRPQGLVQHPDRFAIALQSQDYSATALESLGLSFVRHLNSDFSIYEHADHDDSTSLEISWRNSPLIREVAPVFIVAQSNSEAVVLDELIISLAEGIEPDSFFAGNPQFSAYRPLAGTSDQFIATVVAGIGEAALAVANELQGDARLAWVEPNFYQDWQKFFTPNDPRFTNQWHLNNTGQSGGTVDADSDLPEAWDVIQGGSVDYTIGIIDDGVVTNHPDLTVWVNPGETANNGVDDDGNGWIDDINGWNFVSNNNQSSNTSPLDMHGTSVAGVAAAKGNNGVGVAGASYGSKVLSVRIFEGSSVASDANIASALYYAAGRKANGSGTWKAADVLNNSWGGGASSTVINNALTWGTTLGRQGKGAPIFVAAGNEFGAVSEPALQSLSIPGVFAVGATNNKAEKSDYSNFGAAVDLVTPSSDSRSGYLAIDTTDRPGSAGYDTSDYTGTGANGFGGTSSATPLASGIAALTLAKADLVGVTLTPAQLRSYLRSNTDIVGSSAYSVTTGRNNNMGWGRLNAASAVSHLGSAEISVMSTTSELFNSTSNVNFGSAQVGSPIDITLRVRNQGTSTLSLSSLNIGTGPFTVQSGFGSSTLALGAATTFVIRYQPTAEGAATSTVSIGSNDTDESLFTFNLTGTGTASGGGGAGGTLLAWNVNGQTAFGTQGLLASTVVSGITNSLGLTRGSGVTTINTAATDAWGGNGWASTSSAGVAGSKFVSFGFTVSAGQTASLSSLDLNYRRSGTGSANGFWQYQINTGSWTDIGDFADEFSSSASAGAAMTQLSLSGISGLQSLTAGTTVNLRVVPYGATSTGGTWYVYDLTGDDLVVSGSLQPVGGSNAAPTNITISTASIAENSAANANVGTFSTTDPDAGNSFTYSLVTGTGSTDNASFNISGGTLRATAGFDFETKDSYSIRVRTTDQGSLFFEKEFTINVSNVNESPTIVSQSFSLPENSANGMAVGTVVAADVDAGDTKTFAITAGNTGGAFAINATTAAITVANGSLLNFEGMPNYTLTVSVTDAGSLSASNTVSINLTNVNETPTIAPQNFSIPENSANGTAVGTVVAVDPDAGDTKSFAITAGNAGGAFAINTATGAITVANTSLLDFEMTPSFSLTVNVLDAGNLSASNTVTIHLTDAAETFRVTSFTPTNTGFVATFSQPFAAADLNLYGNAALGAADVTVVGSSVGAIRGSLILNAAANQFTFVRTQSGSTPAAATGILPNDTYTVTLRTDSTGFHTAAGALLDGNGDGTAGDNYTTTFVQNVATGAVTVSLPDFARGHGQAVNVPNTSTGLPLYISSGQNVSSLQLTLNYDPALLSITGFTLSPALSSAGVQATPNTSTPGIVYLDLTGTTEFSSTAGGLALGTFTATVPTTASYAAKQLLDITNLVVFDNDPGIPQERASIDDDAVHVAAYFGDTSGNRQIQTNDGTLLARVNALLDSGFAVYQLADPVIIADVNGNNLIQTNDGTLLARFNALISTPQIPTVPAPPVPLPAVGIDPILTLGSVSGRAGETVSVPVTLTVPPTETAVNGVTSYRLLISLDNTQLSFDLAKVFSVSTAGFSVTANQIVSGTTTTLAILVEGGASRVTPPIAPGSTLTLGSLSLTILSGANGTASLNLLGDFHGATTSAFGDAASGFQELLLLDSHGNPGPTNGFDPDSDGAVTIQPVTVQPVTVPQPAVYGPKRLGEFDPSPWTNNQKPQLQPRPVRVSLHVDPPVSPQPPAKKSENLGSDDIDSLLELLAIDQSLALRSFRSGLPMGPHPLP